MYKKLLVYMALKHGRLVGLYRKLCQPNGAEWGQYMSRFGGLHSMGIHCLVERGVVITDPAYVRLGNNVHLSTCKLIGHDGSIGVLERRFGLKLDRVGKIDIGDNVFIGEGAIILPNVTIGSDVIVAAGAVVTNNIDSDSVVGGVPAKFIVKTSVLVKKWRDESLQLPWMDLIEKRKGAFDSGIEDHLVDLRVEYFYSEK